MGQEIQIILGNELMGLGHGQLCFMLILTLCQSHEFFDPKHNPIFGR